MTDVCLKFSHGLGDVTQLTVVLKHLRKHEREKLVNDSKLTRK